MQILDLWQDLGETQHTNQNIDKSLCSVKFNHAGLKYEIVMNLLRSKCMSVVGPFPAGEHDMNVFRSCTKAKMLQMPGKMLIADSIYLPGKQADQRDEVGMFAIPNSMDVTVLKRFKSRARARHESFNGRLKFFAFLRETYRGVDFYKHGLAFNAICVIVQTQMDNGSPIFATN